MSLAAFKRRIKTGQRVSVTNNVHPHLSGERTVEKVQTKKLATRSQDGVWWTDWPKALAVRIEGDTLHFLDADREKVAYSYTFHFEEHQAEPEAPADSDAPAEHEKPEPGDGRTRYRVTFAVKGEPDSERTVNCAIYDADRKRPGDQHERDEMLRQMLVHRSFVPTTAAEIQLLDVVPICNCPQDAPCVYTERDGTRFVLASSAKPGYEIIIDRANGEILGTARNTLSVDFLFLVRSHYEHY
jgi:hypothetical protein